MKALVARTKLNSLKNLQPVVLLSFFIFLFSNVSFSNNLSHHTHFPDQHNAKKIEAPSHNAQIFEGIRFLKEPEQKESLDDKDFSGSEAILPLFYYFVSTRFEDTPQLSACNDHLFFVKTEISLFLLFQSWEIYS